MPATPPRVTVLGSMNMDISVTVPELPSPGATVLGSGARFAPGGKGGNQAVAAARLGAEVRMAGCVGHDEFGGQLLRALGAESVDTSAVREVQGVASGLALITVDSSGENMITVAAGANESVGDEEVSSALAQPPDVLVISAEVPVPAIEAALDQARSTGRPLISLLNLAPVPPGARDLLAAGVGWLVVNETEASAVLGHPVAGLAEAATAATALLAVGATHAVVTAGAAGAAYAGPAIRPRCPASRCRPSTPWAQVTPSSALWPPPWGPAPRPRTRSAPPAPPRPWPPPAPAPRARCPTRPTSPPSPASPGPLNLVANPYASHPGLTAPGTHNLRNS